MAKLSSDDKYVIVEKNDTLTGIAVEFLKDYNKYKTLAAINNIADPNLIYIGQKIYLSKDSAPSTSSNTSTNKASVRSIGLQSNSEKKIFVTWDWDKSNTKHYRVVWYYDTGDGVWFVGSDTTTTFKQSIYDHPDNAKRVKVKIKPISKTHTVNKKETTYWTASWEEHIYCITKEAEPPEVPPVPTVTITEKNKLVASIDNYSDSKATEIQFHIVKNDKSKVDVVNSTIKTSHAACQYTVDAGGLYKVRCKAIGKTANSAWSDYSANVRAYPSAPKEIEVLRTLTSTSVALKWTAVSTAQSYTVEYTDKLRYFDSSPENVNSVTVESDVRHAEINLPESGKEYFFRVKATNEQGDSGWTPVKSIIVGKRPSAPTTWTLSSTAIVGENIYFYWVHNSEDGSSQTTADLELTIVDISGNETVTTIKVDNTATGDDKDKTSIYKYATKGVSKLEDGATIEWRVRTKGVIDSYSPWSTKRTLTLYAKPTVSITVLDVDEEPIDTINGFPIYVYGFVNPVEQKPLGCHIDIIAKSSYETVDELGNTVYVKKGDSVYSKYFEYNTVKTESDLVEDGAFVRKITASDVDFENGKSYNFKCVMAMGSGLTATDTITCDVKWAEKDFLPDARISIDYDNLTSSINPYCETGKITRYKVTYADGVYKKTSTKLSKVYGEEKAGAYLSTGEQVYEGVDDDGNDIYYCEIDERAPMTDCRLAVYRREYDGSFTEIQSNISKNTIFVTDPHPALDYARYRIVATHTITGAVSYYDVPARPVGVNCVVIQWAEEWSDFEGDNPDRLEESNHSSSMIKIPYNIDVSDSNDPDVSLIEYMGRKHPVSYYGTQVGERSTWNVEIPKSDKDTLYALRRLKSWMGDVYVREPSGSGYWANVKVSFSQHHKELTIPVTLTLSRVEGGK